MPQLQFHHGPGGFFGVRWINRFALFVRIQFYVWPFVSAGWSFGPPVAKKMRVKL